MVKVTFLDPSGVAHEVEGQLGFSLMEAAIWNDVPGIEAICGGTCNCATCHVYIDMPWRAQLPEQSPQELQMLDGHQDRREGSRLSCQIKLTSTLTALTVQLPECQRE
ncbi:MAG: 2Fe-2S ferredoxin [Gammaproteobacteria bacterium]|nr:2Fe-2S ferredoxin [Gammaproteobacteria bacterium]